MTNYVYSVSRTRRQVVFILPSIPGADLGVFATKNIPRGTIVSFYPAHLVVVWGGPIVSGSVSSWGDDDAEYFQTHPTEMLEHMFY